MKTTLMLVLVAMLTACGAGADLPSQNATQPPAAVVPPPVVIMPPPVLVCGYVDANGVNVIVKCAG